MLTGLFSVSFVANNNDFGSGVVVIENGKANGGDAGYFYQGRFDFYGTDVNAEIEVRHHHGPRNSVMGPLDRFVLKLSGRFQADSFVLDGGIPNVPNLRISIRGKKISELL